MRKFLIGLLVVVAALVGAFWYFSTPSIPRGVLETKYATGASQFVMLPDGARAHFRDQGPRDAPVLLLIHGSNASLFTWVPWVKRLDDTFRVVTVDMPGHGLTGAVPNGDYSQEGMVKFTLNSPARSACRNSHSAAIRWAAAWPRASPKNIPIASRISSLSMRAACRRQMGDHVPLAFRLGRTPVLNRCCSTSRRARS